ncbi:MAG: regulator of protease activity HflC (stomatin/prohibitin superfamily) [Candidatus Latescibacterota bacterium]|jgi:regulator of protease activity HflC (stomatin/prohibitin superfamily)
MTEQRIVQNSRWARFREKLRESTPYLVVTSLVSLFIVAYLFHRIFITVPAGHAGVHFAWLGDGTNVNKVYGEGLHVIVPWNTLTIYNMRVQEVDQDFAVLTSDGLAIEATMSIRFRPTERLVGMLHKEHGPDYVNSYLMAELGSSARRIIGLVTPSEFYSSARDSVEEAIDDHLRWELRELDEFQNTNWPDPPGYDDWIATEGESLIEAGSLDDEAANSLKKAVFDSLNMVLVANGIDDEELRVRLSREGPTVSYTTLSALEDSLHDKHKGLSQQLIAVGEVLFDSEDERETGLYSLTTELGDSTIVAHYESLKTSFRKVETELHQMRRTLDKIVTSYDRHFMALDVHDVLIKNITLPPQIAGAIQNKLEQEQVAEEFKFRVSRERREAERKRVEAEGIKDFQAIVAGGITEDLLRWKGIEATLELSKSDNAKIIIVGGSGDGLPLILNTQ